MIDKCIGIFTNVFDDEFCNNIINYYKEAEEKGFTKNRVQREGAPSTLKEDESLFLLGQENINSESASLMCAPPHLYDTFNKVLDECYGAYKTKYAVLNQTDPQFVNTIKVQKTKPGQGYHVWHAENTSRRDCGRLVAWTAYMNDEFEAGETEFLYQQYRYKPRKGDLMIFPAGFTHTHRGNPPIGGDKYIITGWIEF